MQLVKNYIADDRGIRSWVSKNHRRFETIDAFLSETSWNNFYRENIAIEEMEKHIVDKLKRLRNVRHSSGHVGDLYIWRKTGRFHHWAFYKKQKGRK